jgi:hypothetical protein
MQKSQSDPKPISIPPEIAARAVGPDQAERMDSLFRKVIAVPRSEALKADAEWKTARAKKNARKF